MGEVESGVSFSLARDGQRSRSYTLPHHRHSKSSNTDADTSCGVISFVLGVGALFRRLSCLGLIQIAIWLPVPNAMHLPFEVSWGTYVTGLQLRNVN